MLSENVPGSFGKAGVKVMASFGRENNVLLLAVKIQNNTQQNLDNLEFQMAPNYFSFNLDKSPVFSVGAQRTVDIKVNVNLNGVNDPKPIKIPLSFAVSFKSSYDTYIFNIPCMFHVLLVIKIKYLLNITVEDFLTVELYYFNFIEPCRPAQQRHVQKLVETDS